MTDEAVVRSLNLPHAAIDQGEVGALDFDLVEYARLRHPAVRWWWGERVIDGVNGAYCYLCDQLVATWARSFPTTAGAIAAVRAHRGSHLTARAASPGTEPPARSAGDDAPTDRRP